ncbi:MAG: hypothetical protein ACLUL2_23105 [Blautia sp.]
MQYQSSSRDALEELTDEHTLVMMSGHPMWPVQIPRRKPAPVSS